MNRFRTKKRVKDDIITSSSSHDAEQSSLPSFKSFRRGKKSTEEEPKKEFDLSTALPSEDNFRTSLLMTNLSARFSMLREQDDPNTKIGKASDDSVLMPRRQSRLADLSLANGLGALADIAEVESIRAPPSASRINSFASDDADFTRERGIMNRPKALEGNNLFGGRQKIYKIPASGSTSKGGMGGRALYDDDVAMSAFQLWRQTEKERRSQEACDQQDEPQSLEDEAGPSRPGSPLSLGHNRRRETSSTTSSASVAARTSTAATSIASQLPPSVNDWQAPATANAPQSASATAVLERSVTRTRRLYEQGLTQDLQDQQSSALSRIDTLARKRNRGPLTPDFSSNNTPSPTTSVFGDRLNGERRAILSKASAPNLRSVSPPAASPALGSAPATEARRNLGASPPLSPPISEMGEHTLLAAQPNDHGKATAMGVFHKPVHPYDESRYAQRQVQLRQGRDTSSQRLRAESNASFGTARSRSSSSVQRKAYQTMNDPTTKALPSPQRNPASYTFLDDPDDSVPAADAKHLPPLHPSRPSDKDHPAFREPAQATLLPIEARNSTLPSPISPHPNLSNTAANSPRASTADSPTLGPTAGLSGMVLQHLRSESNASSVNGANPPAAMSDLLLSSDGSRDAGMLDEPGARSVSRVPPAVDGRLSRHPPGPSAEGKAGPQEDMCSSDPRAPDLPGNEVDDETTEFASQLADARRRVRERLTSYVESDSSRAPSPVQASDFPKELPGDASQSHSLGISLLRPKSSRGSLGDRPRTQSKAAKMLGISSSPSLSASLSPGRQSFEERDPAPLTTMEEEPSRRVAREASPLIHTPADSAAGNPGPRDREDEEPTHPGLRAFRQARRELQKRKELESLARRQAQQISNDGSDGAEQPSEHQPTASGGSEDLGRIAGHAVYSANPKASIERDRSSSEMSIGSPQARSRLLKHDSALPGEQQQPLMRPSGGVPQAMTRSPGRRSTDSNRFTSHMPPQGHPNLITARPPSVPPPSYPAPQPRALDDPNPGHQWHESESSSVTGLDPSGFIRNSRTAASTELARPLAPRSPTLGGGTGTISEPTRRAVQKGDISEPTFVHSTSRIPTMNLNRSATSDSASASRSGSAVRPRSGSNSTHYAPPVPPINPRRKWDGSRVKAAGSGSATGSADSAEGLPLGYDIPHQPLEATPSHAEGGASTSASHDDTRRPSQVGRRQPSTTPTPPGGMI